MNPIISRNMNQIKELCRRYSVKSLYLFGSAATEDQFTDDSDIDFLVAFPPMDQGDYADNFFAIAEDFEKLFHRSVDLITEKSLSNPYFIESLNKTRVLLYGS